MAPRRGLAQVLEPLPRHYNGQGVLRPSICLQLRDESFQADFSSLWDEHVDFGTARSHKKLLKRDREASEWRARLAAKQSEELIVHPKQSKKKRSSAESIDRELVAGSSMDALHGATRAAVQDKKTSTRQAAAAKSAATVLANKGRWGSTLASQLLGR
eukprot:scaffold84736_cov30-Tisochrysis_lutea.AAC.5